VYNTTLNFRKFKSDFEGALFFSPSGVSSYIQENSLENSVAFCIGNTTANEAKKYTSDIVVGTQATIESTIDELNGYFKG
jgi:uroporphyrinogen-III synthase